MNRLFKNLNLKTFLLSKMRQNNNNMISTDCPESYWIQRKKDVIGRISLQDFLQGRQVDTYQEIFNAIKLRSVNQLVDLGCNTAALGKLLYHWGYSGSYIGVDTNPYSLRIAQENLGTILDNFHLTNANIRELPFDDRLFQCVVMKDVMEHMEDFRPLLFEAARISNKYVIITNFIPWTEGSCIIRREPQGFYHNMYNRREVYSFGKELGLEVEEVLSALEKDARANEVVIFKR